MTWSDLQKNLFKKRSVLLKAHEKSLDATMQSSLRRRADKDATRVAVLLDEKIQIQQCLQLMIEQHLQRLDRDVYRPLELPMEDLYPDDGPFSDIPDPPMATAPTGSRLAGGGAPPSANSMPPSQHASQQPSSPSPDANPAPRPPLLTVTATLEDTPSHNQKVSPRKRASLADEPPTDPNEPVYCYCQQVSWGDMIACDNEACIREWFHYACVGLTAPPKGKWFCGECKTNLTS